MYEKTALQLKDLFVSGEISAVEIVNYFFKRINKLDRKLGAFLQLYPERTLSKAKELDEKRKKGVKLGALAGIPIALKDNIHIKGELTTCASKILSNYQALFDATSTKLLEEEDALILGKTNLDEFAMGGATEYSAFLKTHNPWKLSCTPGGSSGGSAACVSARLAPFSLGSDTGGSVRQPASYCGIVGYKPTYGRISRYGLVAFGSSLDQIGTFSYNTKDMALIASVLGQHCIHDATSLNVPKINILEHLKKNLEGVRVGIPYDFLTDLSDEMKQSFDESVQVIKDLGGEIVEVNLSVLKYAMATYYIIATAEASTNLARFDGVRYGNRDLHAKNLDELYDLTRENGFGTEVKRRIVLGTYVLSSGYSGSYYKKALGARGKILDAFNDTLKSCDLVIMPTAPTPAFETGSIQDPLSMYLMDLYTVHANLTGLPALSIPAGFAKNGNPIGLQMIAKHTQDHFLIGCAHAFEQARPENIQVPPFAKEAV
ncbi:MAG: Glutamyl-tRNA(Gln) amidotransferase subunit A [Chlamydiae bacterium]|nr:Glutamyl-tRNA(Gln) amidotransferase subunit A [Chlamydiota bacterium]